MENPSIFDRKNGKTGLLSATSVGVICYHIYQSARQQPRAFWLIRGRVAEESSLTIRFGNRDRGQRLVPVRKKPVVA